jgi:hypothetical protein
MRKQFDNLPEHFEFNQSIARHHSRSMQCLATIQQPAQPKPPTPKPLPPSMAAPIDFRDGAYAFLRAVDGDTIVVEAPSALRGWVKDVRVRLYGVETPELWESRGIDYREHLEELCRIDAQRLLHVVWERRRLNTQYEGFPESSFEREIGHVFFRNYNGRFLYVNGLIHLLPHATYFRDERILLRGRRYLPYFHYTEEFCDRCLAPLTLSDDVSPTLREIASLQPPTCLLEFTSLPTLDPRRGIDSSFLDNCCCAAQEWMYSHFRDAIERQRLSLFDVLLAALYRWRRYPHDLTKRNGRIDSASPLKPRAPLTSSERSELSQLRSLKEKGLMMTRTERSRLDELSGRET